MWTLWFILLAPAEAITHPSRGAWVQAGPGAALAAPPLAGGGGAQLSAGAWWGHHDEAYALGKFTGVGLSLAQSFGPYGASVGAVELRRGADLLVVQVWAGGGAGVQREAAAWAPLVRASAGAKYRFSPEWGLSARLDLGGVWATGPAGVAGLGLGLEWSGARVSGGGRGAAR